MRRTARLASLAAALVAAAGVAVPAGAAETAAPPSHLAAYNLAWLNYLDPADIPATRYATCLVDSGVRETPDTPATNPEGPIIARLAVDGGPGEPEGESDAQLHGTRMAMAMAAPQNDWGTIGTWSGSRIVSVRGTTAGEETFRAEYYAKGIKECLEYQANTGQPIAAISFSLGCECSLSEEEQAVLQDRIAGSHDRDVSVVAAAGNGGGRAVQIPGAVPGAFVVAGGDLAGGLCGYSSFGPEVAVLGPACPIDLADPLTGASGSYPGGGTSAATAVTSALIAALRSLRPDATWQQAESWVRDSARRMDGHRALDGKAAALAAGLAPVVARAEARQSGTAPTQSPATTDDAAATTTPDSSGSDWPAAAAEPHTVRLPTPEIALARFAHGRLTVQVSNRRAGARLLVTAERLGRDGLQVRSTRQFIHSASRLRARPGWPPGRLRVRFLPAAYRNGRQPSRRVLLYRHGGRFR